MRFTFYFLCLYSGNFCCYFCVLFAHFCANNCQSFLPLCSEGWWSLLQWHRLRLSSPLPPLPFLTLLSLLYSCPCPSSTRIQLMCFDTHIVSLCAAASRAGAELGRVVRALQGGAQGVPSSVSLFPSHSHSTGVWHKCLYKKKSTFICEHAVNCKLHS